MFPLSSPFAYASKREYNAVSIEIDEIWQYRTGGSLTIFDKDRGAGEEGRSQTEAFATIDIYSWWQSGEIECVANWNFAEGGDEAGRAQSCIVELGRKIL